MRITLDLNFVDLAECSRPNFLQYFVIFEYDASYT